MVFIITDILNIDPCALEFSGEDNVTVFPSAAYEILGTLDGKKIETYGVVWQNDNQSPGCFLSEELDDFLSENHADLYTEAAAHKISSLIFQKFMDEDVDLPLVIWGF
ncbi:MAG: hypothetical protein COB36_05675 [Alphaproteobacteria bacterium]|nr:MAG: hypothetical protein COB36_05675 [Alphaproteobacteria bacterium]